jgi:hypothetical protein
MHMECNKSAVSHRWGTIHESGVTMDLQVKLKLRLIWHANLHVLRINVVCLFIIVQSSSKDVLIQEI